MQQLCPLNESMNLKLPSATSCSFLPRISIRRIQFGDVPGRGRDAWSVCCKKHVGAANAPPVCWCRNRLRQRAASAEFIGQLDLLNCPGAGARPRPLGKIIFKSRRLRFFFRSEVVG